MRYSQSRHYDQQYGGYITETRAHLDCGHTIMFYGSPREIDEAIRANGVTHSGMGTRCKDCTARYQAMVQAEIEEARREARR